MKVYRENSRPVYYRAMKYWGKKPHNIWGELIKDNTKEGDLVLDPFSGSSLAFFESIRINRFPYVMDINPLSIFIIDVYSEKYNPITINIYLNDIISKVVDSEVYKLNYLIKCDQCGNTTDVYNYVWENNDIISLAYKCNHCLKTIVEKNKDNEFKVFEFSSENLWKPTFDMGKLTSVSKKSIEKFGGRDISNLWTNRNFELLIIIFNEIMNLPEPYKKLFLFAFLQSIHLTTKMCAARSEKSKRPLSTSWGRPAYMALNRKMEQNPIIQLIRAFKSKSGIFNALNSLYKEIGTYSFSKEAKYYNKVDGIALQEDAKNSNIYPNADFIITDPPYGNIIQYGELSMVWNIWLINAYPEYSLLLENEVILNTKNTREDYEEMLTKVFKNCYLSLKKGKKMIFTFNSKDQDDWETIKKVIKNSGFSMEDVYLQINKRASEANVAAKKGLGISDYYIVLNKENTNSNEQFNKMDDLLFKEGVIK